MTRPRKQPLRRCIGCMERAPKYRLVRLVWNGAALVVDAAQRLPGRGAYVHACRSCVTAAGGKRWERALRLPAGSAAGQKFPEVPVERPESVRGVVKLRL